MLVRAAEKLDLMHVWAFVVDISVRWLRVFLCVVHFDASFHNRFDSLWTACYVENMHLSLGSW